MSYLQILNRGFSNFLDQGDPRIKSWPLMQTPFPGWVLIAAYVYFVKVAGPNWMKRREAFELRNLMAGYNFTMVFVNFYVFYMLGKYGWFNNYSWRCQPVDFSESHDALIIVKIGWVFYITKFVEFADTIFFVLRKKDKHISALHVIHHSIVPFSLWFGLKFAGGGYNAFFPFLNSLVHVIMYIYYGLAALGPQFQKYLTWKKYMTYIQMSQFVLVVLYGIHLQCFGNCEISTTFIVMNIFHAMLFLVLFYNFFRKAYGRHIRSKAVPSKENDKSCHQFLGSLTNSHSTNDAFDLSCQVLTKDVRKHPKRAKNCETDPLPRLGVDDVAAFPPKLSSMDFSRNALDISKLSLHANGFVVGQNMGTVLRSRFPVQ